MEARYNYSTRLKLTFHKKNKKSRLLVRSGTFRMLPGWIAYQSAPSEK